MAVGLPPAARGALPPAERGKQPAFTLDAVWLAVAAAYPFVVLNFTTLQVDDGDFWWSLALGRATWLAGALPAADPLPYTPTPGPYVQAQWLANLLLYGTYQVGGFAALVGLRAAIVAAAFALLYVGCRRAGATPALAGLCTLLALPLVNVGLSLRPQVFALVPFVLYLEGTRRPPAAGRALYLLPVAMVFWANVHGSFVFGLLLVGIALVARLLDLVREGRPRRATADAETRALAILLLLSGLASLVTPYGLGFLAYLRDYMAVNPGHLAVGGLLTEWLPTSLVTPGGVPFFASALVLLVLLYLNARWRAGAPREPFGLGGAEALRLLAFGWLALRWLRAIAWWGLVLPAPLASLLQRALVGAPAAPASASRPAANRLLLVLILGVAVASLPWSRAALPGLSPEARAIVAPSPLVEAAERVEPEAAAGRLFHFVAWGGYLAWRLGPGHIFVDGRYEAYRPEVFDDYTLVSAAGPGWEARLADYGVGQLMLSRAGQPGLVAAVERSPAWQPVYQQGDVAMYRSRWVNSARPPAGRRRVGRCARACRR
jgi:hypothetical protein